MMIYSSVLFGLVSSNGGGGGWQLLANSPYAWLPVLNPLVMMATVKKYRQTLLGSTVCLGLRRLFCRFGSRVSPTIAVAVSGSGGGGFVRSNNNNHNNNIVNNSPHPHNNSNNNAAATQIVVHRIT